MTRITAAALPRLLALTMIIGALPPLLGACASGNQVSGEVLQRQLEVDRETADRAERSSGVPCAELCR